MEHLGVVDIELGFQKNDYITISVKINPTNSPKFLDIILIYKYLEIN